MVIWIFFWYSFFGYLLEKAFAAWTESEKQTRKGFVLFPLCPVYGLAMLLILWQIPQTEGIPLLIVWLECGILATLCEYGVDLFYDTICGVRFWDYSKQRYQIHGRVCLSFSLIWAVLATLLLRWFHPSLLLFCSALPKELGYGLLLVLTVDGLCSSQILRRFHDTELLSISRLRTWRASL